MEYLKNLWAYKFRMFIFVIATAAFAIFLFPFGDLSDKITSIVSEATENRVYLQFDDLSLTMIPQPALKMTNVLAETPTASDITVPELSVAPSILMLIKQKPMGHAVATGLMGGELDVNVSGSSKIASPNAMAVQAQFTDFQMKQLIKTLQLAVPFTMSGKGRMTASVDLDPEMKAQPEGDVEIQVNKADIPSFAVPIGGMAPLPIPGMNLEKVSFKGKLKNGQLQLAETQIGGPKDEINAKVTGTMDMHVFPGGNVNVGIYNLAIDLNIKDSAQAKLGSMMFMIDGFLKKYSSKSVTGTRYAFRIQANGFNDPAPKFSEL